MVSIVGFSALHLRQSAGELVRLGLEWLDTRVSTGSEAVTEDSSPFFLYLHFMEAHERHRRPEAELDEILASRSEPWLSAMVSMAPGGVCDRRDQLSCRQWLAYGTAVVDLRSQVASLLAALESRGLLDESVVVLYSDHGEEFMDHYDEGRRVGGDPRSLLRSRARSKPLPRASARSSIGVVPPLAGRSPGGTR